MRQALLLLFFAQLALAQPLLSPEWNFTLPGNATGVAMSGDAQYILAGSEPGRAVLLGAGGEELWARDYEEGAATVAISHGGERAAAAHGPFVTLLDRQGSTLWNANAGAGLRAIAVSESGDRVAAANSSQIALIENGSIAWNYSTDAPLYALAVSGQGIFGGSYDGSVQKWSLGGALAERFQVGGVIYALAAGGDGSLMAVGGADKSAYLVARGGQLRWKYDTPDEIRALAMTPGGEFVLAGTGSGDVFLLDRGGKLVLQYDAGERIAGVALSDDGRNFAVAHGSAVQFFDASGYYSARLAQALQLINGSERSGADLSRAEELYAAANTAMRDGDYAAAMALAQSSEEAADSAVAQARSAGERAVSGAEGQLGAVRAEGLGFLASGQLDAAGARLGNARALFADGRYADAAREANGAGNDAAAAGNTARLYVAGAAAVMALLFLLIIAWRIPAVLALLSPSHMLRLVEQALLLREAGQVGVRANSLKRHLEVGKGIGIAVDEEAEGLRGIAGRLAIGERLVKAMKLDEGQAEIRGAKKELDALLEGFRAKLQSRKEEYEAKEREVDERAEEFRAEKEKRPPAA